MVKQSIGALVEGGKASAGPPLGPALGPLGVNIGQVIAEINKKTAPFSGMNVPVKVIVDIETKSFNVEVGMPPTSQLILKELGIKKGSKTPKTDKIGNMAIEQAIKIAKAKKESMLSFTLKNAVLEVIGTCQSLGVLVEGKEPKDAARMIKEGDFADEIKSEKTQVSADKTKNLAEQLEAVRKEIAEELAEAAAAAAAEAAAAGVAAEPEKVEEAEKPEEEKPEGKEEPEE